MKAKGNAILKKGNKTIKAEVIEYDEISEKIITSRHYIHIDFRKYVSKRLKTQPYRLSDETGQDG